MTTKFESMFRLLCLTVALSILAGIRPGIAAAADLSSVKAFDIPPQPVPSALLMFSSQSGVQVTSSAEMLEGKRSPGVKGTFTAQAALDRLLSGTGLHYDVIDRNTIAIRGEGVGEGSQADSASPPRHDEIAYAGAAAAQPAPAAAPSSEQQLAEVLVTGSLIGQRQNTPSTPIVTMGSAAIKSTGAVTLEGALSQLPQFGAGSGSTTNGFFASGQASLNLRGLGPSRNLVLLDGHRMQPDAIDQSVDINMIPPALIESVDVITGGASAVYGSDAVAGVVNFRTKKHFSGVQLDAEYAPTQSYGGAPQEYTLTAGGNFADNRGNAVVSVDYTKRGAIPFLAVPFDRQFPGYTEFHSGQGTYEPAGNSPSQAAIDSLFASYGATPPPNTALLGINPDDSLFAATNGLSNFKGGLALRPDGQQIAYTLIDSTVQTPLERYVLFGRSTYDITDDISAYAQVHFVNYTSDTLAESGNTTLSIPVTNPFIPGDLATLLASRADPTAPLSWDKRFYEAGPRDFNRTFNMFQFEAGLSGGIEPIHADWDLYGSRGTTNIQEKVYGSVVGDALNALIDAPDGGNSICAGGYDPFGLTRLSQACLSYLTRTPLQVTKLTQDIVQATLRGPLWKLPMGEIRYAVGVDYRRNGFDYSPDSDIALGTIVGVPSAGPSSGTSSVKEEYAEVRVPLLTDEPLAKAADLDIAYRHSNYNLAGAINAYKADFTWTIFQPVRLRGGYERAVRAPNVGELFLAPSSDFAQIGEPTAGGGDPCNYNSPARQGPNAAQVRALCLAQGISPSLIDAYYYGNTDVPSVDEGNTKLTPETADTYTAGVVLTAPPDHPLISRMQLSLDYYDISVKKVIGVLPGGLSLDKCFNLDGSNPSYSSANQYCQLLTRDPVTGGITSLLQVTANLGALKTRGIDAEYDWSFGLQSLGVPSSGVLELKTVASRLIDYEVQALPGGPFSDYTNTVSPPTGGSYGSLPKWKDVTTIGYVQGSWSAGARWRYIGAMRSLDTVSNPQSTTPGTTAYSLFDLFGSWDVSEHLTVNAGVNNLMNRQPMVVDGIPGNTEPSTYDILGRSFFVAASARF
jgi:outer membrane receptor protein involved in Fe transport